MFDLFFLFCFFFVCGIYFALIILVMSEQEETINGILLLMGKLFNDNFEDGSFKIDDKPLLINEIPNSGEGTALTIWDGSIVLSKYFEYSMNNYFINKNVLELGSGTGVVGISCALLNAKLVEITDLPYSLDNMNHNIELNRKYYDKNTIVKAKVFDWFKPPDMKNIPKYDTIIASDVVWIEDLIKPLVNVLKLLATENNKDVDIYISHQTRSIHSDNMFFGLLNETFTIEQIPHEKYHPKYEAKIISIYKLKLKV